MGVILNGEIYMYNLPHLDLFFFVSIVQDL